MLSVRCPLAVSLFLGALVLPTCALGATTKSGPSIIVNGDPTTPMPVTSNTFGFGSDANGGGDYAFTNDSGQNWTRLDFIFSLPQLEVITCQTDLYATCTQTTTNTPNGVMYDLIMSGQMTPGDAIDATTSFSINLNNGGSTTADGGSWPVDTDFTALANVPEPASVALGGLGFLVLAGYCLFSAFGPKRFSKAAN